MDCSIVPREGSPVEFVVKDSKVSEKTEKLRVFIVVEGPVTDFHVSQTVDVTLDGVKYDGVDLVKKITHKFWQTPRFLGDTPKYTTLTELTFKRVPQ